MPWTDETEIFIRTVTKSTLLDVGREHLGPEPTNGTGTRLDGSPMVVSPACRRSTNPSAAIGILGAEVYDAQRATLTELAFRAKGQYAAYYPDSTSTSRDKKNVRDGHYTVWSPTVWMDNIDGDRQRRSTPDAQYVIDLIAGKEVTPAPNFDPNVIVARVGLVPDCAMRVQRSFDGGPLSLYKPAESCTCKFESVVDTTELRDLRRQHPVRDRRVPQRLLRGVLVHAQARDFRSPCPSRSRRRAATMVADTEDDGGVNGRAAVDAAWMPDASCFTNPHHPQRDHQRVHDGAEDLQDHDARRCTLPDGGLPPLP